jgi:Icc-related predicted phosphoesterase
MRICCASDLHGHLPDIPPCDVLAIAGDICPDFRGGRRALVEPQAAFLNGPFIDWIGRQPCRYVVGCWGNHDWVGADGFEQISLLVSSWIKTDQATTIDSVKFWTTPWQPWFGDWAFSAPRDDEGFLEEKWRQIPADTDVLIVHGPPREFGDLAMSGVKTGSTSLSDRIRQIQPALVVCGHIHEGYGVRQLERTTIVNASLLDQHYSLRHAPILIDLSKSPDLDLPTTLAGAAIVLVDPNSR